MTAPRNRQGPWLLRPALTPASRTPWGGTKIGAKYKAHLGLPEGTPIGESWEVSVDPLFPSRLIDGEPLAEALARLGHRSAPGTRPTRSADEPAHKGHPPETPREREAGIVGIAGHPPECTLLLKLLDTADNLSVQIHPDDDYEGLAPGESGKPESWYILECEPGAGLYLGFRPGVRDGDVRRCLAQGGQLVELMHFVPVAPGDFFLIEAGTPHAIGRGVTLLEPQRVIPGRQGVTYRYWDWGRRYDDEGALSPNGRERELHEADALAVTDWERITSSGFVSSVRVRAGGAEISGDATAVELCKMTSETSLGTDGGSAQGVEATKSGATCGASPTPRGLTSRNLGVSRLSGSGSVVLARDVASAVLVVAGKLTFPGEFVVSAGNTAYLPAAQCGLRVELEEAHVLVSSARGVR